MISHLGPQMAIADGVALAYKLSHGSTGSALKVSMAFTGDGGVDLKAIAKQTGRGLKIGKKVKQDLNLLRLCCATPLANVLDKY